MLWGQKSSYMCLKSISQVSHKHRLQIVRAYAKSRTSFYPLILLVFFQALYHSPNCWSFRWFINGMYYLIYKWKCSGFSSQEETKTYNQSPLSVSVLTVLGQTVFNYYCCKIVLETLHRMNVVLECFPFSFVTDLNVLRGKLSRKIWHTVEVGWLANCILHSSKTFSCLYFSTVACILLLYN